MKRLSFFLVVLAAGPSSAADAMGGLGYREPAGPDIPIVEWVEQQVEPPALPKDVDLVEFYFSAGTANRFFIDGSTLGVGSDGIVRYVLVVRTSGGATNTTFEGIRCKTGEYKLYASGRADGTWARSRIGNWRPIEDKLANRHHAALNRDLFCPLATPIDSADDGREALRRSKHPRAP